MKRILVGICGIGNGHINRQTSVIKELIKKGYEVLVATEPNKVQTIAENVEKVKVIEINIPWIVCDKTGFNFEETLNKYNNTDIFKKFLELGIEIEKSLNGKPDLVISDYEPNVAQYAYATGIPLITMEQQSKFLYLKEVEFSDFSIKEEMNRINYFFPKYDKKIISSFFPINIGDKNIIQVPPIISSICKNKINDNFVMIYLSPYSDSEEYEKVINIVSKIENIRFKVYSKNHESYFNKYNYENIEFSGYCSNFKKDLSTCSALITTGGHQLISEAISIDVPLYVMPLNTYEQNYNAYMVNKYELGTNRKISEESLRKFIEDRDMYRSNINKFRKKYYKEKWEKTLIDTIEQII